MVWLPESEKSLMICLAVSTRIPACGGQTDGQRDGRTSFDSIVLTMHSIA